MRCTPTPRMEDTCLRRIPQPRLSLGEIKMDMSVMSYCRVALPSTRGCTVAMVLYT